MGSRVSAHHGPGSRLLTPSILVRIQVPQPVIKHVILQVALSFLAAGVNADSSRLFISTGAPADQALGYAEIIEDLSNKLCQITGYDAFSLQPNSGAQGEYAGLLTIRAYHRSRGEERRNICLIPDPPSTERIPAKQCLGDACRPFRRGDPDEYAGFVTCGSKLPFRSKFLQSGIEKSMTCEPQLSCFR